MRMGACRADGGRSALCGPTKLFLSQNERTPGVQTIIQQPLNLSTWTDVLQHFLLAVPRNTKEQRLLKKWKNLRPGT
jgi:hypothetical protein